MEGTPWGELSLAGILLLLVLREVFSFLKASRNGNGSPTAWAIESAKSFGIMTAEIRKLNQSLADLSTILQTLSHEVKATRAQVKEARKDIEELKRRTA